MSLSVYPNPTFENATIRFKNAIKKLCKILIINELGQVLKSQNIFINKNMELDFGGIPQGIYFIKIENSVQKVAKF